MWLGCFVSPWRSLIPQLAIQCPPPPPPGAVPMKNPEREEKTTTPPFKLMYYSYFIITGGFFAGSLAIQTDAAHLLSDFASFCISLFALWVARRPATISMSFGYYRAGKSRETDFYVFRETSTFVVQISPTCQKTQIIEITYFDPLQYSSLVQHQRKWKRTFMQNLVLTLKTLKIMS